MPLLMHLLLVVVGESLVSNPSTTPDLSPHSKLTSSSATRTNTSYWNAHISPDHSDPKCNMFIGFVLKSSFFLLVVILPLY